jgi:hypothetical protein
MIILGGGRAGPQTEHFISASTWGGPDPEAQTHATPSAVTGYAVSRQQVKRWRPDAQTGSACFHEPLNLSLGEIFAAALANCYIY